MAEVDPHDVRLVPREVTRLCLGAPIVEVLVEDDIAPVVEM